jgi:hypothetical protein
MTIMTKQYDYDDRRYRDYDESRGENVFRETIQDRFRQLNRDTVDDDGDWDDMDHD